MTRARDLSKFANSQAFSVDSDFQVGINSTVPAATLDVRGDSVITGILTATSIDATGLTGTPDITVNNIVGAAATFSGVVTYEDVTNVDSVGVVTARTGVKVTAGGVDVTAGGLVVTAGVSTFSGAVSVGDTISLGDHDRLRFGAGNDLQIYHDESNSRIVDSGTGQLILQSNQFRLLNAAGSENLIDANENGAVTLYYDASTKLETTATGVSVTGDVDIADKIIHTGDTDTAIRFPSANIFTVETGGTERLRVDSDGIKVVGAAQLTATQPQINFTAGGSAVAQAGQILVGENGGGGDLLLKTKTTGGTLTTRLTVGNDGTVNLPDNGKLTAGAGDDLEIYHDGTNSVIDNNTGDLNITTTGSGDDIYLDAADDIYLRVQGNESGVSIIGNGAVELYHNNSKKIETTSSGVTVTGAVTDSIGSLRRVGIHGATVNFTLTTDHPGKLVRMSGSGKTIAVPQNVLSAGDMVTMFNVSSGTMTIEQGTGTTIYNAADGATGNRTVAAKGLVTLVCTASNEFVISGTQLT